MSHVSFGQDDCWGWLGATNECVRESRDTAVKTRKGTPIMLWRDAWYSDGVRLQAYIATDGWNRRPVMALRDVSRLEGNGVRAVRHRGEL